MWAWAYFGILIAIIIVLFVMIRRPMYETMIIAFLALVIISGQIGSVGTYVFSALKNNLLYAIVSFIAFSVVLDRTGVVNDFIDVIVALVGRFSGGAGYVALAASSMMGALSGTGGGNAAAIGSIVIPTMKKTGFSSELAATVEMSASALGPTIPPSGTINIVFGILISMYPDCCTFSEYWLMMWVIALWFIFQRFLSLYIDIKRMGIGPIPKEERQPLGEAFRKGWRACLLPVIVFLPFLLDAKLNATLFTERMGAAGAKAFSGAMLAIVPSICIVYILLACMRGKEKQSLQGFIKMFSDSIPSIAPVAGMVIGGFGISELFNDIGVGDAIVETIGALSIPYWVFAIVVPLVCAFFGMFLESTTMLYMFTMPIVALAASVGFNPIIAAGMVGVMTTSLGHMTPPFGQTFFVCLGVAKSDFFGTLKAVIPWCIMHYIFEVLVLFGIIPIFGAPVF